MRRSIVFVLLFIFCSWNIFAIPVKESTARLVALHFYKELTKESKTKQVISAEAVYTLTASLTDEERDKSTLMYIFNINKDQGFVIIAGDDSVEPLLAYSEESGFDPSNIPSNLAKWLERYKQEMVYLLSAQISPTDEIRVKWKELISGAFQSHNVLGVNPLLTTKWNQWPYYNDLCPTGTPTGCTATAMAQVMKFWNHPKQGSGFHSYNENDYGTLSANFGGTVYNWALMPTSVSSQNTSVATLMYHCGVSVEMDYSPQSSGAWVISAKSPKTHCAEYAFKTYFQYSKEAKGVERANYSATEWINLLKTELNAGRPVLHAGYGKGGHAFVCDGYTDAGYFHYNWGWGGQYDGYFLNNMLNPGGGDGFNDLQEIIIGLKPVVSETTNFALYSTITVNPNPVNYEESVTVNADIINKGSSTFFGEITAALFDQNYKFVEYIQTLTESNGLPPNYHYINGNNFTNTGLSATPGDYYIGIFVKPTGGNWIQVGNGSYQNMIPVTITHKNTSIKMYGSIMAEPDPIVQNEPASIWTDIANFGSVPFNGIVSLDLHDLNGNWVQTIDEKNNVVLPVNTHFTQGITFTTPGLFVSPGTYQLVVWEKPEGGDWELVGSTSSYPNPVQINIIEHSIIPDIYENNNDEQSAYPFNPQFINNASSINTEGSNMHNVTDYDYYKIVLPAGFKYNLNARVHDLFSSGNGMSYTNDVLWSYNSGSGWSAAFDDVMTTGNINVNGSSTIYFRIGPYFDGTTGTYLLDIKITRSQSTDLESLTTMQHPQIFPNPANDQLLIQFPAVIQNGKIELFSSQGQWIKEIPVPIGQQVTVDVNTLPSGPYLLKIKTNNQVLTKKIIITH